MRVVSVGGGPAGLYASMLLKRSHPDWDLQLVERNPEGATYGWGVVFSDRTLSSFREADYRTYKQITDDFVLWEAIDVRYRDEVVRCEGQPFSGIARKHLLGILRRRCEEVGVELSFETDVSDDAVDDFDLVLAADGVRSVVRSAHSEVFRPRYDEGRARYIWYGTRCAYDSFTFAFRTSEHGLFQAHAYPFDGTTSTFIIECAEDVWRAAGLDAATEQESTAYCEKLFAGDLRGHGLMSNNSRWMAFVTLRNGTWRCGNRVLLGDAAHTAHFSIGSGTKLAMEDAISLANAFETHADIDGALAYYEADRKPRVERFQDAARQSQSYFENTGRYLHFEPVQFAFHLLTRSGRIDYNSLRVRDARLVGAVDRWFAGRAAGLTSSPPSLQPTELGGTRLANRVCVQPGPRYASRDGVPGAGVADDLERAAATGAGAVFTELVAVSAEGRITPGCSGLYAGEQAGAWGAIVERVSTCSLVVRLNHAGRRGATRRRDRGVDVALAEGWPVLAASPLPFSRWSAVPQEIDGAGMDSVRRAFADAAGRAADAGFHGVQVFMAHGYLLGGFLSPLTNRRGDSYGGSLEARMRFPLEVFEAVRERWPEDRLLCAAIGGSDWARGGWEPDHAVVLARQLKERGCDLVEVRAGQTVADDKPLYDPYWLAHYSDRIRNGARIATIATGAISSIDDANTLLASGRADLCLLTWR